MQDLFTFVAENISRAFENLIARVSGPMKFRLILQPIMAIFFAVRAGLHDAKNGVPPYFWTMFTSRDHRRELLRQGWKDVGKIFLVAILIDVVYQIIVIRWVYPGEALLVATVLALVPYLVIRGPITRIARRKRAKAVGASQAHSWRSS